MGLLRWGEPLDGGEKRRIPNRRLVLRFWRREDGGGDGLPELWRDCPFFQSVGQFPSWPGTYKGLVRPKALRKAGDLCSRQWEERLAGRALWRQCLWERGDLSLSASGGPPASQQLSPCRWAMGGRPIEDIRGGTGSTLLSTDGERLIGRGEDPQQQLKWGRHSPNPGEPRFTDGSPLWRWGTGRWEKGCPPDGRERPLPLRWREKAPPFFGLWDGERAALCHPP